MIPQQKSAAVTRGLYEAFGVTEFDGIRMIKDLASSAHVGAGGRLEGPGREDRLRQGLTGNGFYKTCGKQDTTKRSESSQKGNRGERNTWYRK